MKILCFFLLIIVSCGRNTTIVNTWRDPDVTLAKGDLNKVLVIALLKNEHIRRTVEDRVVAFMPDNFHPSYSVMTPEILDHEPEDTIKLLDEDNFDGMVTMRLVDIERDDFTKKHTSPNNSTGFHGWFGTNYPSFSKAAFFESNKYYIVETCVFSAKQNKLIWSGTTKSVDIDNIHATVDGILQTLYDEMKIAGFIRT